MRKILIKNLIKITLIAGFTGLINLKTIVTLKSTTFATNQNVAPTEMAKKNSDFANNVSFKIFDHMKSSITYGFIPKSKNNHFFDKINKLRIEIYPYENGTKKGKSPISIKHLNKINGKYFYIRIQENDDHNIFDHKNPKQNDAPAFFYLEIFDDEKNELLSTRVTNHFDWNYRQQKLIDQGELLNNENNVTAGNILFSNKNQIIKINPDKNHVINGIDCSEMFNYGAKNNLDSHTDIKIKWFENNALIAEKTLKIDENNTFNCEVTDEINKNILKPNTNYRAEIYDLNDNFLCKFNHTIKK